MMKRLSLTILFGLVLSGCIFDPVFDTSSWDAYQRSADAINSKLSNDDSRRLNVALKYLMFESLPTASVEGSLLTRVGANPNIPNPNVILALLGPKINGRSAAEIVSNLSLKLDAEIAAMEARKPGDLLGTVGVYSPSYYWRQSGRMTHPVIEFSVRNEGIIPISRVFLRMSLITPGRSVPWASQMFVEDFSGGLEPREKRQISIQALNAQWRDPQLQYLPKAELKVAVTNFANVNGVTVVAFDSERLELERKIRAELN